MASQERLCAPGLVTPGLRSRCGRAWLRGHLQRQGPDRLASGHGGPGRQVGFRRRPVRGQGRGARDHGLEREAAEDQEIDTVASFDGDFTLRLEFRASRDANSGLHLRDKAFAHQLQIRDYPRVGPYKTLKNYRDGDWNAIEVVVTGTKARCTCNGEVLEAALEIPEKGPLALQSEINLLEYRNIRVKSSK